MIPLVSGSSMAWRVLWVELCHPLKFLRPEVLTPSTPARAVVWNKVVTGVIH